MHVFGQSMRPYSVVIPNAVGGGSLRVATLALADEASVASRGTTPSSRDFSGSASGGFAPLRRETRVSSAAAPAPSV